MASNASKAASLLLSHVAKCSSRPFLSEIAGKNLLRHSSDPRNQTQAQLERKERLRQSHKENIQSANPSAYASFINALYPTRRLLSRLEAPKSKKALVNHTTLLKQYAELPSPGVAHMEPADFEAFMKELLRRRDFVKPGLLASLVQKYYLPLLMLRSYRNQLEQRDAHVKMCWKVIEDVKKAGIPLLVEEQDKLIYYSFFRDRKDILQEIQQAHSQALAKLEPEAARKYAKFRVNPPSLNWAVFKRLREQLPAKLPLSTVNVLLFSALRNNSFDVVNALKSMINLNGEHLERIEPDSETFLTLIYGYTDHGDLNAAFEYASFLVNYWPQHVDIKTVNAIIAALVKSGNATDAAKIVRAVVSGIQRPLDRHESYLKRLTPQDDEMYAAALMVSSKNGIHKVYPTENTFLPLLDHYCSKKIPYPKVSKLLGTMENVCHLPLTTRVFVKIFESFKSDNYSFKNAQDLLAKVISLHDAYNSTSSDLRLKDKIGRLHMHPEVESWLQLAVLSEKANLPVEQGAFLKLLDRLVLAIYDAFVEVAENHDIKGQIASHKNTLFDQLLTLRALAPQGIMEGPPTAELYRRDESNYIKKGHLIDLLDMVT